MCSVPFSRWILRERVIRANERRALESISVARIESFQERKFLTTNSDVCTERRDGRRVEKTDETLNRARETNIHRERSRGTKSTTYFANCPRWNMPGHAIFIGVPRRIPRAGFARWKFPYFRGRGTRGRSAFIFVETGTVEASIKLQLFNGGAGRAKLFLQIYLTRSHKLRGTLASHRRLGFRCPSSFRVSRSPYFLHIEYFDAPIVLFPSRTLRWILLPVRVVFECRNPCTLPTSLGKLGEVFFEALIACLPRGAVTDAGLIG